MKKKSHYLTAEETAALFVKESSNRWDAMADEIDAAWAEMPEDIRDTRGEQGTSLAGAVHALRMRGGK